MPDFHQKLSLPRTCLQPGQHSTPHKIRYACENCRNQYYPFNTCILTPAWGSSTLCCCGFLCKISSTRDMSSAWSRKAFLNTKPYNSATFILKKNNTIQYLNLDAASGCSTLCSFARSAKVNSLAWSWKGALNKSMTSSPATSCNTATFTKSSTRSKCVRTPIAASWRPPGAVLPLALSAYFVPRGRLQRHHHCLSRKRSCYWSHLGLLLHQIVSDLIRSQISVM